MNQFINILPNLCCTVTNLYALFPIYVFYKNNMIFKASFLAFTMVASICYHLIEHHKHNMPGIGLFNDKLSHQVFLNLDRFCSLAAVIVCYNYDLVYQNGPISRLFINQTTFILLLLSTGYAFIAETLLTPKGPFPKIILEKNYIKWIYVFTHSLWHIGIFATAHEYAKSIV